MRLAEILKHPLVIVGEIFLLGWAFFSFGPGLPLSVVSRQQNEPLIVSGDGKATVVPDIARVSFGIEETGANLTEAQDKASRKSQAIVDQIKKLGVAEKDIRTVGYNVYPEYNYQENPQRIIGYRVSISYDVKLRKIDQANNVLVALTSTGANRVGGVSFELADETKLKLLNEARQKAVADARSKADGLANAAGVRLGRILNISESQGGMPMPMYARESIALSAPAGDTRPAPDIQPGESEINVMVSISWEIR